MLDVQQLPQPYKKSINSAIFKSCVEDFVVNEILSIDFSESGEHLWLKVTKININTAYLAKELAKWAKIPAKDVGYSGLKDRKGVTTQWFSLRIPKKIMPLKSITDIALNENESIEILETHWHNKKLNKGTHKSNAFIITLRQVDANHTDVRDQLSKIKALGLPNYFGEQRFGRDGNNIPQFIEYAMNNTNVSSLADKKQSKKRSKLDKERSILISSARSAIFNEVLAKRVSNDTWNKPLAGDIFNLSGSSSVFTTNEIDEDILRRVGIMDIHPTGVLWGLSAKKTREIEGDLENSTLPITVKTLEKEVVNNNEILQKLAEGLEGLAVKEARRSLRLQVHDLSWQWSLSVTDNKILTLKFELPTGSYATNVINSLINV